VIEPLFSFCLGIPKFLTKLDAQSLLQTFCHLEGMRMRWTRVKPLCYLEVTDASGCVERQQKIPHVHESPFYHWASVSPPFRHYLPWEKIKSDTFWTDLIFAWWHVWTPFKTLQCINCALICYVVALCIAKSWISVTDSSLHVSSFPSPEYNFKSKPRQNVRVSRSKLQTTFQWKI
jgi:hypothetical protein